MGVCESVCWIYICTECIFVLSFPDPANLKQAVIPSISTRGMQQEYRTTIKISPGADCTEISCPCGRPQVSGLPDAHLIAHAEAAGHEPRELLLHRDTVQGWREQYPLDFEFVVPSRQEVFANDKMKDGENLLVPTASRRRRGRPSNKKRKKGVVESGLRKKRKTATCSLCDREGHNKRRCPRLQRE